MFLFVVAGAAAFATGAAGNVGLRAPRVSACQGRCCWSRWGDKDSCGWYPADGSGGKCSTDLAMKCSGDADCPATPPTPTPPPPTPPTPTPPTPAPMPPSPTPTGSWVSLPETVLAFYYFVDDCPEARLNIPAGMLTSGNAIFLSFIADDVWDEVQMNKGEVAAAIKKTNPTMYIAYSVGGQVGSSSQALYEYLSNTDEDTIVATILGWKYADGIDWDLEPPSGGVASKYGTVEMAKKLASISRKVQAGGKTVTMAGFGAWVWDDGMSNLNGELIVSNAMEMFGIMVYPPEQGSGEGCISYYNSNWAKGAQAGSDPAIKGKGTKQNQMAGGLAGPASVTQAVDIATAYHTAGFKGVIVWMVKPDKCSNTMGWVTKNSDLPKWKAVLDALKGKASSVSTERFSTTFENTTVLV